MLDPSNGARWFKKAAQVAGVGWAGWHTLRHTAASMAFRHGKNAAQVQRMLGHHSPAFTLATYIHLLPEDLADADYLDGVLPLDGGNNGATRPAEIGRETGSVTEAVTA
jgi:integrase